MQAICLNRSVGLRGTVARAPTRSTSRAPLRICAAHQEDSTTKDAGQINKDKDEQFQVQQDRLAWRKKYQVDDKEARLSDAHHNLARDDRHGSGPNDPRRADREHAGEEKANPLEKLVEKLTGKDD